MARTWSCQDIWLKTYQRPSTAIVHRNTVNPIFKAFRFCMFGDDSYYRQFLRNRLTKEITRNSMFGRKILVAALLVYLAALGCGLTQTNNSRAESTSRPELVHVANLKPFCGAAIQIQRVDWIDKYEQTIDDIAADGGDTVSLVVGGRVENGDATQIYLDMRKTPTQPQLEE